MASQPETGAEAASEARRQSLAAVSPGRAVEAGRGWPEGAASAGPREALVQSKVVALREARMRRPRRSTGLPPGAPGQCPAQRLLLTHDCRAHSYVRVARGVHVPVCLRAHRRLCICAFVHLCICLL